MGRRVLTRARTGPFQAWVPSLVSFGSLSSVSVMWAVSCEGRDRH